MTHQKGWSDIWVPDMFKPPPRVVILQIKHTQKPEPGCSTPRECPTFTVSSNDVRPLGPPSRACGTGGGGRGGGEALPAELGHLALTAFAHGLAPL